MTRADRRRIRWFRVGAAALVLLTAVVGLAWWRADRDPASTTAIALAEPVTTTTTTTAPATTSAPPTTAAPTTTPASVTTNAPVAPPVTQAKAAAPAAPSAPPAAPPSAVDTSAPSGTPAQRLYRGGNGRPVVALSFDAGSDTGYAAQILDLLAAEGVKASFGITGKWAEQNPALFRRIVNEGHHLINHTYDHASMTGVSTSRLPLSTAARLDELRRADEIFVSIAGKSSQPWFRPPYGDMDRDLDGLLGSEGYRYNALWSLDSLGWKGLTAPQIVARCVTDKALVPGAILLFHVGSQSADAAALAEIIAGIRARGLQPGTVADVI